MAAATASIRELRNRFRRIKRLVEQEGEILVTDRGRPRYRLTLYTPPRKRAPAPKDYLTRLRRYQPRPMSQEVAKTLHDLNRGER